MSSIRTDGLRLLPAAQALLACCADDRNRQARQFLTCEAFAFACNNIHFRNDAQVSQILAAAVHECSSISIRINGYMSLKRLADRLGVASTFQRLVHIIAERDQLIPLFRLRLIKCKRIISLRHLTAGRSAAARRWPASPPRRTMRPVRPPSSRSVSSGSR